MKNSTIKSQLQPGVHKLIHHLDHLKLMIEGGVVAPIHVSVWPTLRCQFKCSYCCCRNTKTTGKTDLDINDFKKAVDVLFKYGNKAIEFSGGGEPLLWEHFDDAVDYVYKKGIKISLITNGVNISKISKETLSKLSWLRISFQSLNHAKSIDYNHLIGTVRYNASFIVTNQNLNEPELEKLFLFVKEKNISLRIAIQRPSTIRFENKVNKVVKNFGAPLFFSNKENGTPLGCYMAWIRPAIDWEGNFLPCPSIQLNSETEGQIPDNFKLCHISNLEDWLIKNRVKDLQYKCKFCNCGKEHNDFIYNLIKGVDDVEFV